MPRVPGVPRSPSPSPREPLPPPPTGPSLSPDRAPRRLLPTRLFPGPRGSGQAPWSAAALGPTPFLRPGEAGTSPADSKSSENWLRFIYFIIIIIIIWLRFEKKRKGLVLARQTGTCWKRSGTQSKANRVFSSVRMKCDRHRLLVRSDAETRRWWRHHARKVLPAEGSWTLRIWGCLSGPARCREPALWYRGQTRDTGPSWF